MFSLAIYCFLFCVFIQQSVVESSFNLSNFNFSVHELYELSGEASGEYNVTELGVPCDFGARIIGSSGPNSDRGSVPWYCLPGEVCGTFNSSVVVKGSGSGHEGVVVVSVCLPAQQCPIISCKEARSQSLNFHGLVLSSKFQSISNQCSRSCCGPNQTCTTYPLSEAPPSEGNELSSNQTHQQNRNAGVSTSSPSLPCGFDGHVAGIPVFLNSPNRPASYGSSANCEWIIRSKHGMRLVINFTSFYTEPTFDVLKIYENNVEQIRYSGNEIPAPFISETSEIRVQFTSDPSVEKDGFEATVQEYFVEESTTMKTTTPEQVPNLEETTATSSKVIQTPGPTRPPRNLKKLPCGYNGILNGNPVQITSPEWPRSYPNAAECEWRFRTATPGYRIQVSFDAFNTEAGYDFVMGIENEEEEFRFSGATVPLPFTSAGSSLRIRFKSDDSMALNGFSALVQESPPPPAATAPASTPGGSRDEEVEVVSTTTPELPPPTTVPEPRILPCGFNGTVSSNADIIQSPGWPKSYVNDENCTWRIQASTPGYKLEIVFAVFDMEMQYDFVEGSENGVSEFRFSGSEKPPTYISRTSSIMIQFKSDDTITRAGFEARVREIYYIPSTTETNPEAEEFSTTEKESVTSSNNKLSYTSSQSETTKAYPNETTTIQPTATEIPFNLPCGYNGFVTSRNHTLTSPRWPETYGHFVNCQWRIRVRTPGHQIKITFFQFHTESSYDVLKGKENGVEVFSHSGMNVPSSYVTTSGELFLNFTSDNSFAGRGFQAIIKEVLPEAELENSAPVSTTPEIDVSKDTTQRSPTTTIITTTTKQSTTTTPEAIQTSTQHNTSTAPSTPITSASVLPDESFLPSCSVNHVVHAIFRCQYVFSSPNIYRGPVTCRNEINEAIRCVGRQLAQCRVGGMRNALDGLDLPLFNSKTMLSILYNLSIQTGKNINDRINTFCFHAGLNLTLPYKIRAQIDGCQNGVLDDLVKHAKVFYYNYAWARNKIDICRAFRNFKQWFINAASNRCNFNFLQDKGYTRESARYLARVANIALHTIQGLETTACKDSEEDSDLPTFLSFDCENKKIH